MLCIVTAQTKTKRGFFAERVDICVRIHLRTSNTVIFQDTDGVQMNEGQESGVDSYTGSSTYFLHYLLLKSTGYQPPQLRQTVIDSVSPALLNDLQKAGKTKENISMTPLNPKAKNSGSFH